MLKELLIALTVQKKSINQVALEFNTSKDIIRTRLEMLAHLGYINKIEGCDEKSRSDTEITKLDKKFGRKLDNSKDYSTPNYCSNCIISKSCKKMSETERKINTGYTLTKKGKKLISD